MSNYVTSLVRNICPLFFLLVLSGCKDTPQNVSHVSPSAPQFSAINLPTNQVKHVARVARQIVITNAFVVGTNYAELARRSPETLHRQNRYPDFFGYYYTATNLANRIADADHIVVTYGGSGLESYFPPATMLLFGNAAKQVVKVVSHAGRYSNEINPGWIFPGGEMAFYNGKNQLAYVRLMDTVSGFSDNDGSRIYTDYSGVLGTLRDTCRAAAQK